MPSLTCVSSCDSCAGLSIKIAELEQQISELFKLHVERDQEVILGKTQAAATSSQVADTVHFSGGASPPAPGATSENYWLQRGAKPKGPINSTPRSTSPIAGSISLGNRFSVLDPEDFPPLRSTAPHRSAESQGLQQSAPPLKHCSRSHNWPLPPIRTRRGKQHFTPNPQHRARGPITGSARPLGPFHSGDFPLPSQEPPNPSADRAQTLLGGKAAPFPRTSSPGARGGGEGSTARSSLTSGPSASRERGAHSVPSSHMSCPSVRREPGGQSAAPSAAAVPGPTRSSAQAAGATTVAANTRPGPSVLVLGSSMVRHVRVRNAYTSCHPGALVLDINRSAPNIIRHYPSASTVVIHAGINDLKLEQSEKLKDDFITLINTIHSSNKQCIISGPLPPPRFGNVKYSRLRLLHVWLKTYCMLNRIPSVDNFLTFFNRPGLFKKDRLHPNIPGSRLLSQNIKLTIESSS